MQHLKFTKNSRKKELFPITALPYYKHQIKKETFAQARLFLTHPIYLK
jgi:hypothetical protein